MHVLPDSVYITNVNSGWLCHVLPDSVYITNVNSVTIYLCKEWELCWYIHANDEEHRLPRPGRLPPGEHRDWLLPSFWNNLADQYTIQEREQIATGPRNKCFLYVAQETIQIQLLQGYR